MNVSTTSVSFDPASVTAYVSLLAYCPITSNDTLAGWTIAELPDDCEEGLEEYCAPALDATLPPSTSFPVTCSPSYWESLASSTSGSVAMTTTSTPTQTGIAQGCDAYYIVQNNDTCSAIVDNFGNFTLSEFYGWNPAVGSECQYLLPDYAVCIGVSASSGSSAGSGSAGPTSTTASIPSPIMPGTDPSCTSYCFVEPDATCYDIEQEYDLTADEFNSWNPSVGSDCSNLWASEYICVGAPKTTDIATPSTTMTPTTTTTPTATSTVPSPLEPSTWSNCTSYYYVVSGDGCYDIEQNYGITADEFNKWNPYVGADCAGLWPNVYVCVAGP